MLDSGSPSPPYPISPRLSVSASPSKPRTARKAIFDLHSSSAESFSAADRTRLQSRLDKARDRRLVFRNVGEPPIVCSVRDLEREDLAEDDDTLVGDRDAVISRSWETVASVPGAHLWLNALEFSAGARSETSINALNNSQIRSDVAREPIGTTPNDAPDPAQVSTPATPGLPLEIPLFETPSSTTSARSGPSPAAPHALKPLRVVTGFTPSPSAPFRPVPIRTSTTPLLALCTTPPSTSPSLPHPIALFATSPPPPKVPPCTPVLFALADPFALPAVVGERRKKRPPFPRAPPSSPASTSHIENVPASRANQRIPRVHPPRALSASSSSESAGSASSRATSASPPTITAPDPPKAPLPFRPTKGRSGSIMTSDDPSVLILKFARQPSQPSKGSLGESYVRFDTRSNSVADVNSTSSEDRGQRTSRRKEQSAGEMSWDDRKWNANCWTPDERRRQRTGARSRSSSDDDRSPYHFEESVFASPRSNSATSLSGSASSSSAQRSPAIAAPTHVHDLFASAPPHEILSCPAVPIPAPGVYTPDPVVVKSEPGDAKSADSESSRRRKFFLW